MNLWSPRRLMCLLIPVVFSSFAGCYLFEEDHYYGECDSDDDLSLEKNLYDGAVCVNGHAACADGRPVCSYFTVFRGQNVLVGGCLKECIDCPPGKSVCYHETSSPKVPLYFCVDQKSDCFGNWSYENLPHTMDFCPTAAKECLKGSD